MTRWRSVGHHTWLCLSVLQWSRCWSALVVFVIQYCEETSRWRSVPSLWYSQLVQGSLRSSQCDLNPCVLLSNIWYCLTPPRVHMNAKAKAPPAPLPALRHSTATSTLPDARAKQILKEAVDAVVNSFAKHTQGYGRGRFQF